MAHGYRNYSPDQMYLLPIDPTEWLPEDSLAHQVREVVDMIDLSLLHAAYSKDGRGAPAFSPKMLLCLLFYGRAKGIASSRKLKQMCIEDLGARYLCAGQIPDHRSIQAFRKRHTLALASLFVQTVHLCQKAGLVDLLYVATDGTKIAGNAAMNSAMTYAQINQEHARLKAQVEAELRDAIQGDEADDVQFGADHDGFSAPPHLKTRQARLEALRRAREELEQRARDKEHKRQEQWDQTPPAKRPHKKTPDPAHAAPQDKDRYNFTDPDSRMMKGRGCYVQGYNAQVTVDSRAQVIVSAGVTRAETDHDQLLPMIDQAIANTGSIPKVSLADGGYFNRANIEGMQERGVRVVIPADNSWSRDCAIASVLPADALAALPLTARYQHILRTEQGRLDYSHRLKTVEPVFAQIKGSPGHVGFTRFLRRGLLPVCADWFFECASHNLGKLMRHLQSQRDPCSARFKRDSRFASRDAGRCSANRREYGRTDYAGKQQMVLCCE